MKSPDRYTPPQMDDITLTYCRLGMATMSHETYEIFPDGALCDRQLYEIFLSYREALQKQWRKEK